MLREQTEASRENSPYKFAACLLFLPFLYLLSTPLVVDCVLVLVHTIYWICYYSTAMRLPSAIACIFAVGIQSAALGKPITPLRYMSWWLTFTSAAFTN
jgi:hypothetical protein